MVPVAVVSRTAITFSFLNFSYNEYYYTNN